MFYLSITRKGDDFNFFSKHFTKCHFCIRDEKIRDRRKGWHHA
nr:MAG TPA: hypothetical protein [Caudoviricetes sp.]